MCVPPKSQENCVTEFKSVHIEVQKHRKQRKWNNWGKRLKHQICKEEKKELWFLIHQSSLLLLTLISQITALHLFTFSLAIDINHNEAFQCLISSIMHRYYLGLFRHAESMLMAEHPVSDVLFSLYARRHLGKSQGRKMKVRGIANIHPRQLFMNIKEQLWMEAGSHHFLLIILKYWNALQLNGWIPSKVCDHHSFITIKFN